MDKIERKRIEVNILKAKSVIAEKEYAIMDREVDIERLQASICKQKDIIKEQESKLIGGEDV